jgi:hypothetical protein
MPSIKTSSRPTPFQILVHLFMAPQSSGTFNWQLAPDQMSRLADDLRWLVLRRVFPALNGSSPYKALLQKHAIRVDSLDSAFFREVLDIVKEKHAKSFNLASVRKMDDLECLREYFLPVILEWAASERSTSVSRERTPSIEEMVYHEDSSGNVYQRFPDEFAWILSGLSPDNEPDEPRVIPDEQAQFARRIASMLTISLRKILDSGRFDKYLLLMCRLEDSACTWEMTFDYLQTVGIKKYSNWKSLSVVANRALRDFIADLPIEARVVLHQDDQTLTREERHARLRQAVSAALEIDPLPSPREVLAEMVA